VGSGWVAIQVPFQKFRLKVIAQVGRLGGPDPRNYPETM